MVAEQSPFQHTATGEPHHERRMAILARHPEIVEMYGHDVRTAWVTLVVVVAHLGIAVAFGQAVAAGHWFGAWWVMVPVSYLIGAVLTHWCSMTIHETAHDLAFASTWANKALAFFASLPMVIPAAETFHRYHLDHHNYLGVDTADTDLPHPAEVRLLGNSTWKKGLWLSNYLFVYIARGFTFAGRVSALELLNVATQVAFIVPFVYFAGWGALAYLLLSLFFGHSLHPVACHFIHEHYVFEDEQETYSYYGLLNLVTFNVGYHVEHHDFMHIPGWRLPELKAKIPEYYDGLRSHNSWTWVLWHFITAPTMTAGRRIVRSLEDWERGRKQVNALAAAGTPTDLPVRMHSAVVAASTQAS